MSKSWNLIESYTVSHTYEVEADTAEDAKIKLDSFISCGTHTEDIEHIPSLDNTDMYNIECTGEIK